MMGLVCADEELVLGYNKTKRLIIVDLQEIPGIHIAVFFPDHLIMLLLRWLCR
jgi:hypothetical protein